MTGFSTTSRWMLPLLLLPIFIILHYSAVVQGSRHEFTINVDDFGQRAKNCPDNYSSVHVNDKICRCLNLTMSPWECGFPHRYIEGLRCLFNTSWDGLVRDLIVNLQELKLNITECPKNVTRKPVLTTKYFVKALEELKDKINSMNKTTG